MIVVFDATLALRRLLLSEARSTRYPIFPASVSRRFASTDKPKRSENDPEHEDDQPVVYSTSKAAQWKAQYTFRPLVPNPPPEAQRWSVIISTTIFLLYFLVLREENDLDEKLYRPLQETVPDIDKIRPLYPRAPPP